VLEEAARTKDLLARLESELRNACLTVMRSMKQTVANPIVD
jgi:hypothetical protein